MREILESSQASGRNDSHGGHYRGAHALIGPIDGVDEAQADDDGGRTNARPVPRLASDEAGEEGGPERRRPERGEQSKRSRVDSGGRCEAPKSSQPRDRREREITWSRRDHSNRLRE